MPSASITCRLLKAARRFPGAREGNIAVIFAIALLPLLSFVGVAIDYSRASMARSAMQAAINSTALMLSKDLQSGNITASQINTQAQAYFTGLYTNKEAHNVAINATYTASSGSLGSTIQIDGSGLIMTDFMRVAGFPTLNFGTSGTSAWGNVRMRVAMALDNTGSMAQDGKMPALQNAAKKLIDQLSALAKTDGDVYISIVPFAKDVNVGPSNYNQPWVDFTDWEIAATNSDTQGTCSRTRSTTKTDCVNNGKIWTPNLNHNSWNGCVWDRDKDTTPPGYDVLNTAPNPAIRATLFPAEQWSECPVALMPLSYNWTALKGLIDTMTPNGNTNQAIGMAWAWQSLAQTLPLNAPAKDPSYTYRDAIILLSDGLNTQDRWYTNAAQIDARQKILCDNAKAGGITIYTIQLNTHSPADPTSTVLQYCASGSQNFYIVRSATDTLSVFNSIGTSLAKLRVAK